MLAEPFQRVSRYRLMLDREFGVRKDLRLAPRLAIDRAARALDRSSFFSLHTAIIAHLESDNENVEPLLEAVDLLSDICSMEVDDATRKAAALWSLMETIDGFPVSVLAGAWPLN